MAHGIVVAFGGLLVGAMVGLKLPEAPFAMGYGAALLVIGGKPKAIAVRLFAGALGGALGFLLFAGYWMWRMEELTHNPLFPYFNDYFHSPLALSSPYRDERFLPRGLWTALGFPILFSLDWRVADDLPYRDIRVGLAYVLGIAALALWAIGKRSKDPLADPRAFAIVPRLPARPCFSG